MKKIASLSYGMLFAIMLAILGGAFGTQQLVQTFGTVQAPITLVIDAGHGGIDGGAVGVNGTIEQQINLQIATRTQALAQYFAVPTVMTRTDEQALVDNPQDSIRTNKAADLNARLALAQAQPNAVFVSIHLNIFQQAETYGAQVFYSTNHADSALWAKNLQDTLVAGIANDNQRIQKAADSSIFLLEQLQCPAVVVECGFLSNADEEYLLTTPEYQKQLAACIVAGCLQSLE